MVNRTRGLWNCLEVLLWVITLLIVMIPAVQSNSNHNQTQISSRGSIQQKPQGSANQHGSVEVARISWNTTRNSVTIFSLQLEDQQRSAKTSKCCIASNERVSLLCLWDFTYTLSKHHVLSQAKHPFTCLFQQNILSQDRFQKNIT